MVNVFLNKEETEKCVLQISYLLGCLDVVERNVSKEHGEIDPPTLTEEFKSSLNKLKKFFIDLP